MFSIAFAAMKFFVDVRPISGRSVAFGTGGFVVTRARRSNDSLTVASRKRKESIPEFPARVERENFRAAFSRGWMGVSHRARGRVSRETRRAESVTTTAFGE